MEMDRYSVTASYRISLGQKPTFHTDVNPIPFPPKPHQLHEPRFSPDLRPPPAPQDHRLRRLPHDTELSIFDAERYFNELEAADHPAQSKAPVLGSTDASPDTSEPSSLARGARRNRHNGSLYSTPTASSEASWNSRSGLLSNPPGSVAVSIRAFPLYDHSGKGSSSSSACRWLLGMTCLCSGKKAVSVRDKCSVPMSPTHSNLDSIASVSLTKKDSKSGDASCVDQVDAALRELEMASGWEVAKVKLASANWIKDQDPFMDPSNHLSPPREVPCHRIVQASKPFKDGGGGGVAALAFPVPSKPIMAKCPTLQEDPARDSLEVFRPQEEVATTKSAADLRRRAVPPAQLFLRDGAPRRNFTYPPSPSRLVAAVEDDVASDSSSDLFEIESLSTQVARRRDSLEESRRGAGGVQLRGRRSVEGAAVPSVAASECYPPSEVSVEWSVATAEGGFGPGSVANFSSAASDCDNAGFTQLDNHVFSAAAAGDGGRRRGGGLLSCRSEKAVSVGPNPVRFGADRHHQSARVGNASSTAAHIGRAAGAPPASLAHSRSTRQSFLGR